jgi:hypothetical protein
MRYSMGLVSWEEYWYCSEYHTTADAGRWSKNKRKNNNTVHRRIFNLVVADIVILMILLAIFVFFNIHVDRRGAKYLDVHLMASDPIMSFVKDLAYAGVNSIYSHSIPHRMSAGMPSLESSAVGGIQALMDTISKGAGMMLTLKQTRNSLPWKPHPTMPTSTAEQIDFFGHDSTIKPGQFLWTI